MNNMTETKKAPDAVMLLSSSCAHCPGVLDALSKMIKAGDIASLKVINLEQTPEAMQQYNIRSVPWVKIGEHELTGSQTLETLKQRAQWAKDDSNTNTKQMAEFDFLLSDGQVDKVIQKLRDKPSDFSLIMALLADPGTVLSTRIGIGVIIEEFSGTAILKSYTEKLGELSQHSDSRIRADAYHYLGLTGDKAAIPYLKAGLNSTINDTEIKEIITDSLRRA